MADGVAYYVVDDVAPCESAIGGVSRLNVYSYELELDYDACDDYTFLINGCR